MPPTDKSEVGLTRSLSLSLCTSHSVESPPDPPVPHNLPLGSIMRLLRVCLCPQHCGSMFDACVGRPDPCRPFPSGIRKGFVLVPVHRAFDHVMEM